MANPIRRIEILYDPTDDIEKENVTAAQFEDKVGLSTTEKINKWEAKKKKLEKYKSDLAIAAKELGPNKFKENFEKIKKMLFFELDSSRTIERK